ncbi:MAG: hypothetical protein M3R08_00695 [Bacteroidota bacterium]|nr:hypothetical protein [Bacteroidota bacterium]
MSDALKKESSLTVELVKLIGEREKRSYSTKGIAIKVDSVAQDGHTLMCTVFQHRKAPFSKPLDTVALVSLAEWVLGPLISGGFNPMISAIDHAHAHDMRRTTEHPSQLDPIGLLSALRNAGLPFPRLTKAPDPEDQVVQISFWRKALSL